MEVSEYLSDKGIEVKKRRGNELIINCPFCGDSESKGAINSENGAYNCLHLSRCGLQLSFWDFQKKLGDNPQPLASWRSSSQSFVPAQTKKYIKPKSNVAQPTARIMQYLKDRGFSQKTIDFFKIGEKDNAIAFPYFKNKELVGIKYRTLDKKMWSEKDAEPVLFNRDNVDPSDEVLIYCEGEIDCASLHEYGIDSVSIPNGVNDFRWVDNEWEWLQQFNTFYICFDNDVAGKNGAEKLAQKLGAWKCRKVIFPHKDANECLQKQIPVSTMVECIGNGIDFKPNDLTTPDFFTNEIIQLIENPELLNGTQTAWGQLDSILGGWRLSELTIWSGQSGSGKSTILNQQILDFLKRNIGVCVASLEMAPARYLRWMLLQCTRKQFPGSEEVSKALTWMSKNLYVINSTESIDVDVLLDIFQYAARRYNVQHFVIDSLMRITIRGEDKWDAQKEFVAKLLTFAKKFQVHVHLVAHAKKLQSDNDKPDKTSVKGSGDITDLAHNVLVMWKVPNSSELEADALLTVKKNRELGLLDSVGLFFNPKTKLFYDDKEKHNAENI